jgi:Flp pilus assembly protein TadG
MITAKRWSETFLARAIRLSRRLSRNERGSMSVIIAIGLMVLLGFAALGVDVSLWLRAKNDVQAAADAAANSVASAAAAGNPAGRLTAEANAAAAANGSQKGMNGVTVTNE